MNCKPGDLAIMVRSDFPRNVGAIFDVLRATGVPGEWHVRCVTHAAHRDGVDRAGQCGMAMDADLRPIRPGDISAEDVRELYAPKLGEVA